MKPSVDMALFLTAVLKGAHTTRQRHINQARLIQAAIQQRWQLDNPWRWQLKHLQWFVHEHLAEHSPHSRYYYGLTVRLIVNRLGKERDWEKLLGKCLAGQAGLAFLPKAPEPLVGGSHADASGQSGRPRRVLPGRYAGQEGLDREG